jgi:hypothetical protein
MRLTDWLHRAVAALTRTQDEKDLQDWQPPARELASSPSGRHTGILGSPGWSI